MSSSSAGSRSGIRIVFILVAVATLFGAVGAAGLVLVGSGWGTTLASRAEAGEGERSELFTTTSTPLPEDDADSNTEPESGDGTAVSESPVSAAPPSSALIDEVLETLSDIASTNLGSAQPEAAIEALTAYVGPIPAPADATIESFGLAVEQEERDGALRFQYRASVTYYTQDAPEAVLDFYRSETVPLGLPEREVETDSDDDGPFTDIDFGDFGSHPDPLIWWANLSLRVRPTDSGTSVRAFYTVTRTEEAVPSGLATDLAATLPLAEGYEWTSLTFSALTIDPFTEPIAVSSRLAATATTDSVAESEAVELARLADAATSSGVWTLDEQTGDGVWLDRSAGADIRSYATVRITDDSTVVSYSFS